METNRDSKGNIFVNVKNLRITFVENNKRTNKKNWPDKHVLRFQAYKNADGNSLHRGAEIPIDSSGSISEIIKVLLNLHRPVMIELKSRVKYHFTDDEYFKIISSFRERSFMHLSHLIVNKLASDYSIKDYGGEAGLELAEKLAVDIFEKANTDETVESIKDMADGCYSLLEKLFIETGKADQQ